MRREALLIVVAVALAGMPAAALPTAPAGPFAPHAPILISSDAGFTAANGVVAGSGTPADPYVISGWHVVAASGAGITIRDVTASFAVRGNLLEGSGGVALVAAGAGGAVVNNQVTVTGTGILVQQTDALVQDNSLVSRNGGGVGVHASRSNARIDGNAFIQFGVAILAEHGSPVIVGNDVHSGNGIKVKTTTRAVVHANVLTDVGYGVFADLTVGTNVTANFVTTPHVGMEVWGNKDVHIANNTVRYSMDVGVRFETSSGNFTGNVVADGGADGVIIWHSPLWMANNSIENNLGIGFHFSMSAADVEANLFVANGVGLALNGGDVPTLTANVFVNNTAGLSVPYASRQAILRMSANVVNGVNVDGTLDASQRVYFYKAANVVISGQTRDSGFSAGYHGSLTMEGGVVLYEVDTARIEATVLSHHRVGVQAVNSFNVQVEGSAILQARTGVLAQGVAVPHEVPPCAVSVKDTNVTIPVDPVATVGVDVRGCFAILLRSNVSVVDVGVRVDGRSGGVIDNVTVTQTKVGFELSGRPGELTLSGSAATGNRVGARLVGFAGAVSDSRFSGNRDAGVQLDAGARPALVRVNVSDNGGPGVVDVRPCAPAPGCSSVTSEGSAYVGNAGDGVRVNGTATLRGDALLGNGGAGARAGSARVAGVVASGNGQDGLVAAGTFSVEGSTFARNGGSGAFLTGVGEVRDSSFVRNEDAGLRLRASRVLALRLDVRENLDGIRVDDWTPSPNAQLPDRVSVPDLYDYAPRVAAVDALDVHRSAIVGNERDAIRAGSTPVNATYNWFGRAEGPPVNALDQVGAWQNGVTPAVRFAPWYADATMTQTGPLPFL